MQFSLSSQIVVSNCNAPDSIINKYKNDADRLAIKRVFHINSSFKDSAEINKPIRNNYLNALIAVYNATALPARDTIVSLHIHTSPAPSLNSIAIDADSNAIWMKNLRDNIIPTSNSIVNYLMTKYYLQKQSYYSWQSNSYSTVIFKSDTSYNMDGLGLKFMTILGVNNAGSDAFALDGNRITDSIGSNFTSLTYSYGWGDCPSGCGSRRFWNFKVYGDCSVEYTGSNGDALPVSAFVGIDESELETTKLKIYPNPLNGKLNIMFEDQPSTPSLFITNSLGQAVHVLSELNKSQELDLSFLSSGIYFLFLKENSITKIYKVIKE
ncbi:MAG: T9SS type A sorting domain-containing protein [Bacteroidia bacterium]